MHYRHGPGPKVVTGLLTLDADDFSFSEHLQRRSESSSGHAKVTFPRFLRPEADDNDVTVTVFAVPRGKEV